MTDAKPILCLACKTQMKYAGSGIGYFCPNPDCNENLLKCEQYKKIIEKLMYGDRIECEICGTKDKKPTAKYCHLCGDMISEEHRKLSKETWKQAIEIVRNKVKEFK